MVEKEKDKKWEYLYETFDETPSAFTEKFNHYLNAKREKAGNCLINPFVMINLADHYVITPHAFLREKSSRKSTSPE